MQITSNAGWKHVGLGCKLREHCQVRSICTCSVWQSLQTGPKELSECPGDEGNRAIKSSPLLLLLPLSRGRLNTLQRASQVPL